MPKLVYFNLQGRAQAARFLAAYKGIEYEDVRLTFEEWGAAKAAGTYGEGNQLPVWVEDDGKIRNQGKAIGCYLAVKNGLTPADAEEAYERSWYDETLIDFTKPEARAAVFQEGAPQEAIDLAYDNFVAHMTKLNNRWADGRAHVVGASVTDADFDYLARHIQITFNESGRNPSLGQRMREALPTFEHANRVFENAKALVPEAVAAALASGTWI